MSSRLAVAASGGRDSTALLHAVSRAARGSPVQVVALHVHHGLQPEADQWLERVRQQCRRWAAGGLPLSFLAHRLATAPAPGESVEAWARRERYRALAQMARQVQAPAVMLAHHRTDQAETVLLQALRSAGAAGMAAMGSAREAEGVTFLRPWLDQPRSAIEAYVRRHRLAYVDDPSNADIRFARNRLRREVWPALLGAFPHAEAALAGAARRLHEADACARDLAALDAQACIGPGDRLRVKPWAALAPHRRANLLRAWLGPILAAGVPDSLVRRLGDELAAARGGASWPAPGGVLRLRRGELGWEAAPNDRTPVPGG